MLTRYTRIIMNVKLITLQTPLYLALTPTLLGTARVVEHIQVKIFNHNSISALSIFWCSIRTSGIHSYPLNKFMFKHWCRNIKETNELHQKRKKLHLGLALKTTSTHTSLQNPAFAPSLSHSSAAPRAGQHQKHYWGDTCFAYSESGTAPNLRQAPTQLWEQHSWHPREIT